MARGLPAVSLVVAVACAPLIVMAGVAARAVAESPAAAGFVAGAFSLVVGLLFLFELEGSLPDLDSILRSVGLGS